MPYYFYLAILGRNRDVSWNLLEEEVGDLTRFTFGPAESSDVIILDDEGNVVNSTLSMTEGLTELGSTSDDILLRSMFKFIAQGDDSYRIVSTKHSNYALDRDTTSDEVIL